MKRSAFFIAGLGVILLSQRWGECAQAPAPRPGESSESSLARSPTPAASSEVIILKQGTDIGEFLRSFKQPDLILIKPGPAVGSSPANGPAPAGQRSRDYALRAVKVRGRISDDLADLRLDIDLSLLAPGETWVSLGIDGPVVSSAREGANELELRFSKGGQWEARLVQGEHHLEIELKVPINVSLDKKQLSMAIPEAPSTSFNLELPRLVRNVVVPSGGSVSQSKTGDNQGTRLTAHLSPRSRLVLEWVDEASSANPPPPLLSAQVEIAIEPDLEGVTTRSSWIIRGIRGSATKLEIRLDEQDIVQVMKLDSHFLVAAIDRNVLTIPLSKALAPGETCRLSLDTRRVFPPSGPKAVSFLGLPLSNAVEQTGAIAIAQPGNLWISVTASQGLRRIDPRELPSDLRLRPGTGTAYQFGDQPWKLGLTCESYSSLYRSEASTRVSLEGEMAQVETTFQIQRVRGRLFDLETLVPPGLQLISVDPADLVESTIPVQPASSGRPGQTAQVLKIHLAERARDLKSFSLRLRGQQRVAAVGPVKLGLFATHDGVPTSSAVFLFGDRELSFEPDREPAAQGDLSVSSFQLQPRRDAAVGQATGTPKNRSLMAVLRSDQNPCWLHGRFTRHPLAIAHDTKILARLSRSSIDVQQDCELRVRHGTVSSITVQVPLSRSQAWQVQAKETIKREELDEKTGSSPRYRLVFDPPIQDSSLITFRFQAPAQVGPARNEPAKLTIPWIKIEDGSAASVAVELVAASEIGTAVDDGAWTGFSGNEDSGDSTRRHRYRPVDLSSLSTGPTFTAWLVDQAILPPLVVPRVLLHTVVGSNFESKSQAWYWVETHPAKISLRLPDRAQWLRARIDGRIADQVEHEPASGLYRISLPADSQSKPALIELEYQVSGTSSAKVCVAPELAAESVILQTLWEVQVPWGQAIIGVPWGWDDENDWHWDYYTWKRRPGKSFSRLLAWVAGTPSQTAGAEDLLGDDHDTSHSYLFGRSGGPAAMSLFLMNRATIIAFCSGSALLLGFLLMFARARFRAIWIAVACLALAASALAHPSLLFLVIQSALSGVILTLLGLLIQRLIERSRPLIGSAVATPSPANSGFAPSNALQAGPDGVGSDDSTAVRARASSTVDYASPPINLLPEPDSGRGSRIGRPG